MVPIIEVTPWLNLNEMHVRSWLLDAFNDLNYKNLFTLTVWIGLTPMMLFRLPLPQSISR